jgi:hypothetical protein
MKMNDITKFMLLGLATIALSMALEQSSAAGKPLHGGGSFYPNPSTVSQLIADINYANTTGGAITINLAPGASFALSSANNSTDGANGLPVIGGSTPLNLTIIGNGDTIQRIAAVTGNGTVRNPFRLFDVTAGASLTLDNLALRGGWVSGSGGAILNHGTLNLTGRSALSGNYAGAGGADIYNDGRTVTLNDSNAGDGLYNDNGALTVSDSTLSGGIDNGGGTVTVTDTTFSGGGIYNAASMAISGCTLSGGLSASAAIVNAGAMTVSSSTVSGNNSFYGYYGGGFCNTGSGATLLLNNTTVSGNIARFGGGIYNDTGSVTLQDSTLSGNAAHHYDYPWAGGYGGGIFNSAGTIHLNHSSVTANTADEFEADLPIVCGGGLFNDALGSVWLENQTQITGNSYDDVYSSGPLYQDGTDMIGTLDGN